MKIFNRGEKHLVSKEKAEKAEFPEMQELKPQEIQVVSGAPEVQNDPD
jgi:hypothetical protein